MRQDTHADLHAAIHSYTSSLNKHQNNPLPYLTTLFELSLLLEMYGATTLSINAKHRGFMEGFTFVKKQVQQSQKVFKTLTTSPEYLAKPDSPLICAMITSLEQFGRFRLLKPTWHACYTQDELVAIEQRMPHEKFDEALDGNIVDASRNYFAFEKHCKSHHPALIAQLEEEIQLWESIKHQNPNNLRAILAHSVLASFQLLLTKDQPDLIRRGAATFHLYNELFECQPSANTAQRRTLYTLTRKARNIALECMTAKADTPYPEEISEIIHEYEHRLNHNNDALAGFWISNLCGEEKRLFVCKTALQKIRDNLDFIDDESRYHFSDMLDARIFVTQKALAKQQALLFTPPEPSAPLFSELPAPT